MPQGQVVRGKKLCRLEFKETAMYKHGQSQTKKTNKSNDGEEERGRAPEIGHLLPDGDVEYSDDDSSDEEEEYDGKENCDEEGGRNGEGEGTKDEESDSESEEGE